MRKPYAVLGCGPAGLLAAHALQLRRKNVVIFSRPTKSELGGAQFLHQHIPGLTERKADVMVTVEAVGTRAGYQQKVYGDDPNVPFVSFPQEPVTMQLAWNLIAVYERLWDTFGDTINEAEVNGAWVADMADKFRGVFTTIPATALCANPVHQFVSQRIRIHPAAIDLSIPDNHMIYDGTPDRSWYRQSLLFGTGGTEYPETVDPPVRPLIGAKKPLTTNCNCFPGVVRLGRHGQWRKGVLTHNAFNDVMRLIK